MCKGYGRLLVLLSVVLAVAQSAPAADPLVAWWQLDDGAGDVAVDSSGNGLDGTITDANWVSPGYDDTGFCLEMDRAGYVDLGNPDVLNFGAGDWTITAWIVTTITGTDDADKGTIFANGGDWGGGIRCTLCVSEVDDGVLTLTCDDDSTKVQATAVTPVNDGEWHLVAGLRGGTVIRVAIDGVMEGENNVAASYNLSGMSQHNAYVGVITDHRDATLKKMYAGLIDEVRVYDVALSETKIAGLMEGIAPSFVKAEAPNPADGDVTVVTPLLQWTAGSTALFHDVYFGTAPDLGPDDLVQARSPMTLYYHVAGLTPGMTYYWRVDEIESDMTTVHTGDVWTFTAQPYTANVPTPADGENEASADPNLVLAWLAGREAVEHHVYFGSNFDDVNDGAAGADQGTLTETSLVLPQALAPLTTYYWRVDETAADGTVRPGDVWSFSTFSAVEDFESYTDDIDAGEAIFQTWIDGIENGTGSYVGYEFADNGTFGETATVHDGGQSMPLDYNNVIPPYYSEASRTWTSPQNFAAGGADTLVLYARGNSGNALESLYVALEDTAMRVGVAVRTDALPTRTWARLAIPLSVFSDAGVNVAAIRTMYVGLGDRDAPTPGGAGLIFVDDIRLTLPGPAQ